MGLQIYTILILNLLDHDFNNTDAAARFGLALVCTFGDWTSPRAIWDDLSTNTLLSCYNGWTLLLIAIDAHQHEWYCCGKYSPKLDYTTRVRSSAHICKKASDFSGILGMETNNSLQRTVTCLEVIVRYHISVYSDPFIAVIHHLDQNAT